MSTLPLIYVCTPYADTTPAGIQRNVRFAEMVCLLVAQNGGSPYAPHLLLTRFLHDAIPEQRDLGIQCGLRVLETCDVLLAALPPWRELLSRGMTAESAAATKQGLPVVFCPDSADLDSFLAKLKRGEVVRRLTKTPHGP